MRGPRVKRAAQALVGLAISAAALWLTLRGRDLGAIWQALLEADYRYLPPYVLLTLVIYLLRVVRWGVLLEPVAKVPFARLNAASAVGLMALLILPLRLGELARPHLVADGRTLRTSAALSSVVVERVGDGLFMALLLVVTLLAVPGGTPGLLLLRAASVAVFLAFGAALGFLVLAHRNRERAVGLTRRIFGAVSPRAAERLSGMIDAFLDGLRLVPSRRRVLLLLALTACYWGLNGYAIGLLARAFGFDLPFLSALAVLGVIVVGVMIPAGPGMVGTFQAAVVLGLSLFAAREAVDVRGNAFANVLWAVQLTVQVALGLVFLFSRHIQFGRIVHAPEEIEAKLEEEEAEYRAEGERR